MEVWDRVYNYFQKYQIALIYRKLATGNNGHLSHFATSYSSIIFNHPEPIPEPTKLSLQFLEIPFLILTVCLGFCAFSLLIEILTNYENFTEIVRFLRLLYVRALEMRQSGVKKFKLMVRIPRHLNVRGH